MADFTLTQNDTTKSVTHTCGVDLTGATVNFHMKKLDESTPKVDAAATVVDALTGDVSYTLGATDTDIAGVFLAEFEVTYSDASVETFPTVPLVVFIREQLA